MAAAKEGWSVKASDITSAFLQSSSISREVFVRPPPEAGVAPGSVWKLCKTVYGLLDASMGFYINYSESLRKQGMEVSQMDPAFLLFFDDDSRMNDVSRKLAGSMTIHVDKLLSAGNKLLNQ